MPMPFTARGLFWRMVLIYLVGTSAATGVVLLLMYTGLAFTPEQWWLFILTLPVAISVFVGPDIYLIRRHSAPVRRVLAAFERGQQPAPRELDVATAALLNLPFNSFLRVTFVHGPLAALSLVLVLESFNYTLDTAFVQWQIWTLVACIMFFAAPVHAIVEYFSLNRFVEPLIVAFSQRRDDAVQAEIAPKLVAIRLRDKLLYLSLFVAALPLLFFAAAARRIPLSTLGLIQYLGPSIQLLLAVFLFGEPFPPAKFAGYAAIWAGLLLFSAEGLWRNWRQGYARG